MQLVDCDSETDPECGPSGKKLVMREIPAAVTPAVAAQVLVRLLLGRGPDGHGRIGGSCGARDRQVNGCLVGRRVAAGESAARRELPPAGVTTVTRELMADRVALLDYALKAQLTAARRLAASLRGEPEPG